MDRYCQLLAVTDQSTSCISSASTYCIINLHYYLPHREMLPHEMFILSFVSNFYSYQHAKNYRASSAKEISVIITLSIPLVPPKFQERPATRSNFSRLKLLCQVLRGLRIWLSISLISDGDVLQEYCQFCYKFLVMESIFLI